MHANTITLEALRSTPAICQLLGQYFDVEIGPHYAEDWYRIPDEDGYDSFGAEGAGGRYIQLQSGKVLFIDSEGSAGVVAETLVEYLSLAINAAYWASMLHYSAGGQLAPMQTAERLLQSMACDEEDWPVAIRQSLNQALGITPLSSYADRLHQAVYNHAAQPLVLAPDGYAYDKLFGDFQPSDNLLWRDGLQ